MVNTVNNKVEVIRPILYRWRLRKRWALTTSSYSNSAHWPNKIITNSPHYVILSITEYHEFCNTGTTKYRRTTGMVVIELSSG